MLQIWPKSGQPGQAVADRRGKGRLAGHGGELGSEPDLEIQTRGLGPSCAGGEHRHGRVVGEDRPAGPHMPPDGVGQGFQQSG